MSPKGMCLGWMFKCLRTGEEKKKNSLYLPTNEDPYAT